MGNLAFFTFDGSRFSLGAMKVLSYDALARNFPKAWATIEAKGEEVVVTRNRRRVARIVPEGAAATAMDVFGDLHGVLGEGAGAVIARKLAAVRNGKHDRGTLRELRNPWAS
jgi:antitoxin (DNA-binding transcriptional repressor) of toxin-antitoxin stability system